MAETKKDQESKARKAAAPKKAAAAKKSDKPASKPKTSLPSRKAPFIQGTYFAKNGELPEKWKLVDANGQTLGRLSTFIALTLMGKMKPQYTAHSDTGDHVVVVNAEKIVLTGKKLEQKKYEHHTNYPGGIKTLTAKHVMNTHPERLVKLAVYRMLPKSKGHMARHWFKKLKVYAGEQHPHQAQNPEKVNLPNLGVK